MNTTEMRERLSEYEMLLQGHWGIPKDYKIEDFTGFELKVGSDNSTEMVTTSYNIYGMGHPFGDPQKGCLDINAVGQLYAAGINYGEILFNVDNRRIYINVPTMGGAYKIVPLEKK